MHAGPKVHSQPPAAYVQMINDQLVVLAAFFVFLSRASFSVRVDTALCAVLPRGLCPQVTVAGHRERLIWNRRRAR